MLTLPSVSRSDGVYVWHIFGHQDANVLFLQKKDADEFIYALISCLKTGKIPKGMDFFFFAILMNFILSRVWIKGLFLQNPLPLPRINPMVDPKGTNMQFSFIICSQKY